MINKLDEDEALCAGNTQLERIGKGIWKQAQSKQSRMMTMTVQMMMMIMAVEMAMVMIVYLLAVVLSQLIGVHI